MFVPMLILLLAEAFCSTMTSVNFFTIYPDSTSLFDVVYISGRRIFKSVCSSAIHLQDVSCQMSNSRLEDVCNHNTLKTSSKRLFDI